MPKRPVQSEDKYVLRLPDGMRDRLKAAAEANNRTMNSEIIDRLDWSFDSWPRIALSHELKQRALNSSKDTRIDYERQLSSYANDLADVRFPSLNPDVSEILNKLSEFIVHMPTERHGELVEKIKEIMRKHSSLGTDLPKSVIDEDDENWPGF